MKIIDKNPYVTLDAYTRGLKSAKDPASSSKSQPSSQVNEGDKVVLSPRAREVQEIRKMLAEIPEVREDLVAELKGRVESGTYKVDSAKIAARMLENLTVGVKP